MLIWHSGLGKGTEERNAGCEDSISCPEEWNSASSASTQQGHHSSQYQEEHPKHKEPSLQ